MKKGGKVLLTMGIATTMVMGTIGITNITNMLKEEDTVAIQAYNHTPANILDNVFEIDTNKYLPFIFDDMSMVVEKTTVIEEFTKAGLEIESISCSGNVVTTGTTIKVKGSGDIYTVVIYGDVDGDGTIAVFDALRIVEHCLEENRLNGKAYEIAANVDNPNEDIDVFDAVRIVDFCMGETDKLVTNEPTSTKGQDTENPVITIGNPVILVNFGETYEDKDDDVTASDNIDENLSVIREKIEFIPAGSSSRENVTTINTNRIGTYYITYKVSDSSNNTDTAIRTITVKGLNTIKIGNGNHELNLSTLNLYIEEGQPDVEEDLSDHNVYTIVPITFFDQYGTPIDVVAADIQENPSSIVDGKLGINLSTVNTTGNEAIVIKYYDASGNEVAKTNDTTAIAKIGVAMKLQGQDNLDISQLTGKVITFNCRNQVINLPITVNYKALQNLTVNTATDVTTLGQDDDENYVTRLNEEFTLGIVEVGELEQPITEEMIEQGIISIENQPATSQAEFWYELDNQGRVLVKGNIKVKGTYAIKPIVGNVKSKVTLKVKGVEIAKDLEISLRDLETGEVENELSIKLVGDDDDDESIFALKEFFVDSASGKQDIQLKDITYVQKVADHESNYLDITFADEEGNALDPTTEQTNDYVGQIFMIVSEDAEITKDQLPIDVMVTITLYDGLKGIEKSKTIIVHIV